MDSVTLTILPDGTVKGKFCPWQTGAWMQGKHQFTNQPVMMLNQAMCNARCAMFNKHTLEGKECVQLGCSNIDVSYRLMYEGPDESVILKGGNQL